jgi:hypothetical protein
VVIGSNAFNTTPSPDPNAVLWLIGDGKQGLIVPVVTNTTAVVTPSKGMVVYNNSDDKMYFYNGTWTTVGSGTAGTTTLLKISGNTISIDPLGATSFGLSSVTPTQSGQLLTWNGTSWGASAATPVPATGQYLKWNGVNWEPATIPTTTGLTNPMTNPNEMIIGGAGGTPTKLNAPAANQVLAVGGSTAPTWSSSLSLSGSITTTSTISGNGVNITNLNASNINSGTLATSSGGTGATTASANFVFAGPAAAAGTPSFRPLTAADIPALNISKVSAGTLPVGQGGTGLTTLPVAGQLLIGNGAGYTLATLTSAGGISIANAAGAVTIGTSGNFGAQPLTTTGTLAAGNTTITGTAGVSGNTTITGYTQLGSSAVGIQLEELTGTTSALIDGTATIGLTVDQSRIAFVNVFVVDAASELIPPMYLRTGFTTYAYTYYISGSTMTIVNVDTAPFSSSSIRNKTVRVTIAFTP